MNKQQAIKRLNEIIEEINNDCSDECNIISIIIQNDKNLNPKSDVQISDSNYVKGRKHDG